MTTTKTFSGWLGLEERRGWVEHLAMFTLLCLAFSLVFAGAVAIQQLTLLDSRCEVKGRAHDVLASLTPGEIGGFLLAYVPVAVSSFFLIKKTRGRAPTLAAAALALVGMLIIVLFAFVASWREVCWFAGW